MQLYFRHGADGVTVFRIEIANRQRRIELNRIACIAPDGKVVPDKDRPPSAEEQDRIRAWWSDWQERSAGGRLDRTERFIADLNHFTDWLSGPASDAEVDARSDDLLTALLDLRQTVVRRLSEVGAPVD